MEGLDWSEERALFEGLGEFYYSEDVDDVCDCNEGNDELLKELKDDDALVFSYGHCPFCGADLELPDDGYTKCPQCGTEFYYEIDDGAIGSIFYKEGDSDDDKV